MANTFELIASSTVGSGGAGSITFSSIPSTFTDLVVKCSLRTSATGTAGIAISFNSSSSSFTCKILEGNGSSAASFGAGVSSLGEDQISSTTTNTFANSEIYIPNYAGSTNKSFSVDNVTENNGSVAYTNLVANLWSNTSAVTSIGLTPNSGTFVQYSTAYLYGVKNA